MKRKIIKIIEEKCNGCGICANSCAEGAIQIINGKARLINEVFCDGLGACIKECPQDAIIIEEREAKPYNEIKALKNIIKYGKEAIYAHLKHLKEHGQTKYYEQALNYLRKNNIDINELETKNEFSSCPHAKSFEIKNNNKKEGLQAKIDSQLSQWPIQLHLINPNNSYFKNSSLLIAADCTAFSYGNFHNDFIKGKKIVIACPKLDSNLDIYEEKIKILIENNNIKSIEVITMEVPCCFGLVEIVKNAIKKLNKKIQFKHTIISVQGYIIKS